LRVGRCGTVVLAFGLHVPAPAGHHVSFGNRKTSCPRLALVAPYWKTMRNDDVVAIRRGEVAGLSVSVSS
jgi:hypothetical protein